MILAEEVIVLNPAACRLAVYYILGGDSHQPIPGARSTVTAAPFQA